MKKVPRGTLYQGGVSSLSRQIVFDMKSLFERCDAAIFLLEKWTDLITTDCFEGVWGLSATLERDTSPYGSGAESQNSREEQQCQHCFSGLHFFPRLRPFISLCLFSKHRLRKTFLHDKNLFAQSDFFRNFLQRDSVY